MKIAIAAALILTLFLPFRAEAQNLPFQTSSPTALKCHAVDGDTIMCGSERIRIENIDAAEMPPKSKCAYEADLAIKAKLFVGDRLARGNVEIVRNRNRPQDQYGRTLAQVKINGADLGDQMVVAGLVRPWTGKRRPWC